VAAANVCPDVSLSPVPTLAPMERGVFNGVRYELINVERARLVDVEYIWESRDGIKPEIVGWRGESKEFGEVRERA
jgi:hypothetical protein